ncbi:hypothetical protein BDAP_002889 [Binucleata daphniae]
MQPSNKERLYLQRKQMGRGLTLVEHKGERMLLKLFNTLYKTKSIVLRRAAIYKQEIANKTHLGIIKSYLKIKYNLDEQYTKKQLCEAQQKSLMVEI